MGAIEHLTISLPTTLADKMRASVAAGDYANESELIRDALQLFELDQDDADAGSDWAFVRTEVLAALAEYDQDPTTGYTIDEVRRRLTAKRAARRAPAG